MQKVPQSVDSEMQCIEKEEAVEKGADGDNSVEMSLS
jgi:hypothetical protein